MKTRPVHWSEGMLVLPHHFQAAQTNMQDWVAAAQDWQTAYNYGIRLIEINDAALKNFEVRITRLEVRLKDGSLVSVPDNANLKILNIRSAIESSGSVYVHLVLPEVAPGKANATRNGKTNEQRFLVDTEEWEERNEGGNARPIDIQRFNVQLMALPTQKAAKGYESVPLLKLRRSQKAEAPPELDDTFIPPILACHSWTILKQDYLIAICAQLASFTKMQAEYLKTHGGWSEANQPQIRKGIMQLNAVNSSYPYLIQLSEALGVHPFLAYTELCRLVGQLSLFRDSWQPPDLPLYDHDDLGRIFREVKSHIDAIFTGEGPTVKVQRYPFMGVQEWMEVGLDPKWLRGNYGFYVGVRSDLTPERLELLFSDKWLDWKLGSTRTILQIYRNAEQGLSLKRVVGVHSALPALKNVTYFEVDQHGRYWEQVSETRALALKVNENYIRADFIGQNTLTVVDPKQNPRDLTLELFVVENE